MPGFCPFGLEPPECNPGTRWSLNEWCEYAVGNVHVLNDARRSSQRSYFLPTVPLRGGADVCVL